MLRDLTLGGQSSFLSVGGTCFHCYQLKNGSVRELGINLGLSS